MRIVTCCLIAVLPLVGCGKKTPTTPTPTTTGISISSNADFIKIGAQQSLTLTASLSDGTSKVVSGAWSTDAAGIATVTGGLLRGVATGEATISADYDGHHTTRKSRVVPDYSGAWTGSYRITTCTESGVFVGLACDPADVPLVFTIKLSFTQTNASVTGTVAPFTDLTIPAQGPIELDGLLKLSGSKIEDFGEGVLGKGELVGWESRLADATHMTGKFTVVTTIPGLTGDWTQNCDLFLMTKNAVQPTRLDTDDTGSSSAARRLADIIRRPR